MAAVLVADEAADDGVLGEAEAEAALAAGVHEGLRAVAAARRRRPGSAEGF